MAIRYNKSLKPINNCVTVVLPLTSVELDNVREYVLNTLIDPSPISIFQKHSVEYRHKYITLPDLPELPSINIVPGQPLVDISKSAVLGIARLGSAVLGNSITSTPSQSINSAVLGIAKLGTAVLGNSSTSSSHQAANSAVLGSAKIGFLRLGMTA